MIAIEYELRGVEQLKRVLDPDNFTLDQREMQQIGEAQRLRLLKRVEQTGRDTAGQPFQPYSTNGPYYYYPHKQRGGALAARRLRTAGKIGKRETAKWARAAGRLAKKLGVAHERGSIGIKFASYAAFKRSLGRKGVDLAGPNRRMLGQVVTSRPSPGEVHIEIRGEAAARGQGHQEGNRATGLPRRRWLGASPEEQVEIARDLTARVRGKILRASRARSSPSQVAAD